MIEAQGIEAGRGKKILGVEIIIAEKFVESAVEIFAARFGDGVDDGAEILAVVGGERAADDAEFLDPILRGAGMLHTGDAGGVVNAVEAEESAVGFAKAAEAELQNGFGERAIARRRRCCGRRWRWE